MSLSPLSNTIRRTSDILRLGTSGQVTECENLFQSLRALHERLLADFIISDFMESPARVRLWASFKATKKKPNGTTKP